MSFGFSLSDLTKAYELASKLYRTFFTEAQRAGGSSFLSSDFGLLSPVSLPLATFLRFAGTILTDSSLLMVL